MGSDNYPEPEIQAAVDAAILWGDEIILTGPEDQLRDKLNKVNITNAPVRIVNAPDVFKMTDKISAGKLRRMQSSMGVAMDLLKNGEADAFVTAGNTGGAMANGLTRLGRIKGIKRPALSLLLPVKNGYCVLADMGANTECKPENLLQFAIMGSLYAEKALGKKNPRIGLLSNGEEEGKGNDLVKATYPLLKGSGLNFIGNVEGKEMFGGEADVVITDGFTGNVVVKSGEAIAKLIMDILKEELMATPIRKLGALMAKSAFVGVKKKMDPSEVGAAPLLGLKGLVMIGHGRSDAKALVSAIRVARQAAEANLIQEIKSSIEN
jgi:glycerol-3-phosphate acyltransferase PlsX